jgi:hypothetical protein
VHSERFIIYNLQEILIEFGILRVTMRKGTIVWVVTPCGSIEIIHQRYRGMPTSSNLKVSQARNPLSTCYLLRLYPLPNPENIGSMFLQNVDELL